MKKFITNPLAIAVALLVCGYFYLLRKGMGSAQDSFPMSTSVIMQPTDTAFGGVFYTPYINDSLPHYVYKKIEDSLNKKKNDRDVINRSLFAAGISTGLVGVSAFTDEILSEKSTRSKKDFVLSSMYDSINQLSEELYTTTDSAEINSKKKLLGEITRRLDIRTNYLTDSLRESLSKKYYLSLKGYKTDDETVFFIQDSTYNLAYVVWDSVKKRTFNSTREGHYERKTIPVRYAKEDEKILIPLTKTQYTVAYTILLVLQWAILSLWLFFTFGLTLQILISISKGNAFSEKNIYRLRLIAAFIFLNAVIATTTPYLLHLIFGSKIPGDFKVASFYSTLYQNLVYFFVAAIVFIVSIAFKKGYKLQQEQELTV
jgi:Protein of unknown function (DUF2975)